LPKSNIPPVAYQGVAQGLRQYALIEVDGGHETLFTFPALVAEGFLKALKLI